MLERFLDREKLWELKYDNKYKAEILITSPLTGGDGEARGGSSERKVIFCTPQTFMNLSWEAIAPLANFYKISPEDILVLHDEIDFPLGKIAFKEGGGTAGHNGLKSITAKLWSGNYKRIRIGVDRGENTGVSEYVLGQFKPNEKEIMTEKEQEIFDLIQEFIWVKS